MAALISINDFHQGFTDKFGCTVNRRDIMHARPSHVQKPRSIEDKIKIDAGEKPLCVRYAELLRLRKIVLETQSEKLTQDDRFDLR